MMLVYQIAGPILVILWAVIHFAINQRVVSNNPGYHSTRIGWDNQFPFMPAFTIPYLSGYLLSVSAYFAFVSSPYLPRVIFGYALLMIIGGLSYIVYPCKVERRENLEGTTLSTKLLAAFQRTFEPYNSFPSMHVGFSLFSALFILILGNEVMGVVALLWTVLVAASTLFTKLHHFLDIVAGVILALFVTLLVLP
jgi:membrane-associated phospholipid phosphatase